MKKFWIVLSVCWLWTCSGGGDKATGPEEPPIVVNLTSLTGQAQKGPFNNGTSINIAELSNTLSPTGRNFSSAITDNTGRFSVANVQLESPFVELRATGFYFNEVSNNISDAQLTLYALSDLTNKSSLNVNILTHLEKNRMQVLMSGDNPKTFAQAKLQAQEEVLAIFDYSRANMPASELLDISQGGAANAKLLAISAILQGDQTVGQMSELLANISTDLSTDGTLDDSSLQSQLITNTQGLDVAEIRSNLSARFTALGITATIPDFETEINQFLKPPVAQDMSASTGEDTTINITLDASDPEGESLTYTILEVNNATVTLNGNVATYTPDAHFNGTDTFTFYANDGTSDSNIATVTMTVSAEDDEPNTLDVATTTDEDNAVDVALSAEEYDGDSYSFAIVTDVTSGTTSLNGSTVTYTPNQDFNGEDTFTFEATDDTGRTINVATATITVNAVNDAPVANDITNQSTNENRMMQLDITLDATDVDGDALTYSISSASNGTLSLNNDIVTYVPNQDWNGEDTFTYTANDGSLNSNTATVTITVNSVNDAPVIIPAANNGTTTMNEDGSMYEQFTATDVDGDDVTFSIVTNPEYATITNFTNDDPDCPGNCASFTFVPNENWNGTDTFTYKANDGSLDSAIETHTFIVNPVNDEPVAYNVAVSDMIEDDLDGTLNVFHPLRLLAPDTGVTSIDPIISLPDGWTEFILSITFQVEGATISDDNSYININFKNGNVDLVLAFDFDGTNWNNIELSTDSQWDQFEATATANFQCRENIIQQIKDHLLLYPWVDTLLEGVDFFSQESGAQWGGHNYRTYAVRLTPIANFSGTEVLDYYGKCSGCNSGDSNNATITFTVNAVNDAPTTNHIQLTGDEDTVLEGSFDGSDIDGDNLTYTVVNQPSNGTVTIDGSVVQFDPNNNWNGEDTFTYKVNDGVLDSNISQINVTVNQVDDLPEWEFENHAFTIDEDDTLSITFLRPGQEYEDYPGDIQVNDADLNGLNYSFTFSIDIIQIPENGIMVCDDGNDCSADNSQLLFWDGGEIAGKKKYVPTKDFNGSDTITIVANTETPANDGTTSSTTPLTIPITINPVNDAPIAYDFSKTIDKNSEITFALRETSPGSNTGTDNEGGVYDPDIETGQDDDITFTLMSQPSNGTAELISNNDIKYTPNTDFVGTDTFTYTGNDGELNSNTATITINVNPTEEFELPKISSLALLSDSSTKPNGSFISIDDESSLSFDSFTFSIWIKPSIDSDWHNNDSEKWGVLFSDYNSTSQFMYFALNGGGDLRGWVKPAFNVGQNIFTCNECVDTSSSEWSHVVITYDEDNGVFKFYFNGELKNQFDTGLEEKNLGSIDGEIVFGQKIENQTDEQFFGQFDQIAFWSTDLNFQTIQDIYNDGNGVSELRLEKYNQQIEFFFPTPQDNSSDGNIDYSTNSFTVDFSTTEIINN